MELNKGIPVKFGPIAGTIYGGPFKNYVPRTRRLVGVKMAAEIMHPHEISIPTEDFSVPSREDMVAGMKEAIIALANGEDIYAGCMGGIGRTGLFMGCMVKLSIDFNMSRAGDNDVVHTPDPVSVVRSGYKSHAIETAEQQSFVRTFPTEQLVEFINDVIEFKAKEWGYKAPQAEVQVEYPGPFSYAVWWLSGGFLKPFTKK